MTTPYDKIALMLAQHGNRRSATSPHLAPYAGLHNSPYDVPPVETPTARLDRMYPPLHIQGGAGYGGPEPVGMTPPMPAPMPSPQPQPQPMPQAPQPMAGMDAMPPVSMEMQGVAPVDPRAEALRRLQAGWAVNQGNYGDQYGRV